MLSFGQIFAIATSIIAMWYIVRLRIIIRNKGLDPTLATYLSPISLANFWLGRSMIGLCALLVYYQPNIGSFCIYLVAGLALTQILLLILFERTATQPVIYYVILLFICGVLLSNSNASLPAALALVLAQEVVLVQWKKSARHRYNKWVSGNAQRLNHKYKKLAQSMTPREWFCVLHVAVTEDIARPKAVRMIERAYYYIKRPAVISTGIMQVQSTKPLSDEASMTAGAKILQKIIKETPMDIKQPAQQMRWAARRYNGHTSYSKYLFETHAGVQMAWKKIEHSLYLTSNL